MAKGVEGPSNAQVMPWDAAGLEGREADRWQTGGALAFVRETRAAVEPSRGLSPGFL